MAREHKKNLVIKPLVWGTIGAISLFGAYFVLLTLLNSAVHAWQQYLDLWPWMTLLVIGFGIQVGLFAYLRGYKKISLAAGASTTTVVATGGVSTGSMIACCLHHVTDVLPILGLSAAAIFLNEYQSFFLAIGVVSNLVGISFMLSTIQKHGLFLEGGWLNKLLGINMQKVMYIILIFGGLGLILFLSYNLLSGVLRI